MDQKKVNKAVEVQTKNMEMLMNLPNVVGTDVGFKYINNQITEEIAIRVFVRKKKDVVNEEMVPETLEGILTDVIEEKEIVLHETNNETEAPVLQTDSILKSEKAYHETLIGGISTSATRDDIGAGTLGAIVKQNGKEGVFALSNWHVFALDQLWKIGNKTTQQAIGDGGTTQAYFGTLQMAVLEVAYDSIYGPGPASDIDAAIANIENRSYLNWILNIGPVNGTKIPQPGDLVKKQGRTTNLTYGTIDGINRNITITYGDTGNYQKIGTDTWENSPAMTTLNEKLYIVQGQSLYVVNDPLSDSNSYEKLGAANWDGTTAMAALGEKLYIIQKEFLYRVDPETGSYDVVGTNTWANSPAMTAEDEKLYVVQGQGLYVVNDPLSNNNSYEKLGTASWDGTTAMAALGGKLYIIQKEFLYRVDPKTGSYEVVGTDTWANSPAMTAKDEKLYVIQGASLYVVKDPLSNNNSYEKLGDANWAGSTAMVTCNRLGYILQNKSLYKVCLGFEVELGRQFRIKPDKEKNQNFSEPGDSGSVIVSHDNKIEGLLFASEEDNSYTFANNFANVMKGLNINVDSIPSTSGACTALGSANWNGTTAMTALGEDLYIVQKDFLYRVNQKTGSYNVVGTGTWSNSSSMAALKKKLFIVQGKSLYMVKDPSSNSNTYIKAAEEEWQNNTLMAVAKSSGIHKSEHIIIVQEFGLYVLVEQTNIWNPDRHWPFVADKIYPEDGDDTLFNCTAMVGYKENLYLTQNDNLYRISYDYRKKSYSKTKIGSSVWKDTESMTISGGKLYIVQKGNLYRVNDPLSNKDTYELLNSTTWDDTMAMTAINGWIYIAQKSTLYVVGP